MSQQSVQQPVQQRGPVPGQQYLPILDADTAYANVQQKVYAPLFFDKLARDHGVVANTPEEQFQLLVMAAQLRDAIDTQQEKQAAAGGSWISAVYNDLQQRSQEVGQAPVHPQTALIKQAAANASFDPVLVQSVLSLQANAAAAQQAAQQTQAA